MMTSINELNTMEQIESFLENFQLSNLEKNHITSSQGRI